MYIKNTIFFCIIQKLYKCKVHYLNQTLAFFLNIKKRSPVRGYMQDRTCEFLTVRREKSRNNSFNKAKWPGVYFLRHYNVSFRPETTHSTMHATLLTYKHQVSADLKRCPRLIYRYDSFEQSARGTAGILLKLAGVGTKIYITNRTDSQKNELLHRRHYSLARTRKVVFFMMDVVTNPVNTRQPGHNVWQLPLREQPTNP